MSVTDVSIVERPPGDEEKAAPPLVVAPWDGCGGTSTLSLFLSLCLVPVLNNVAACPTMKSADEAKGGGVGC